MCLPLLDKMEIQKKSYFLQMKFFCKASVYGKNWEVFSFLETQESQITWEKRH